MREKIIRFLDEPSTTLGRAVSMTLLFLIYVSVVQVVVEVRYPEFAARHEFFLGVTEHIVLIAFTIELIVRLICTPKPWRYVFSFYGMIDILAVVPSWIGYLVGFPTDTRWLRVFRILRFARVSKVIRSGSILGGVLGQLTPFLALVLGLKGVMVALEAEPWWPQIGNLSVVIGVVGFALAILLGTKLRVVNDRLFKLEDAVCHIVGAMRDMLSVPGVAEPVADWARHLEWVLSRPTSESIRRFRTRTMELEIVLEEKGVGGANTAGFHRDVEYVLHRAQAMTPEIYDRFLRNVTVAYTLTVIFAVPGLTGFVSSLLVTYVMGGMIIIIDDMDSPLEFTASSFIDANLAALKEFNEASDED